MLSGTQDCFRAHLLSLLLPSVRSQGNFLPSLCVKIVCDSNSPQQTATAMTNKMRSNLESVYTTLLILESLIYAEQNKSNSRIRSKLFTKSRIRLYNQPIKISYSGIANFIRTPHGFRLYKMTHSGISTDSVHTK